MAFTGKIYSILIELFIVLRTLLELSRLADFGMVHEELLRFYSVDKLDPGLFPRY